MRSHFSALALVLFLLILLMANVGHAQPVGKGGFALRGGVVSVGRVSVTPQVSINPYEDVGEPYRKSGSPGLSFGASYEHPVYRDFRLCLIGEMNELKVNGGGGALQPFMSIAVGGLYPFRFGGTPLTLRVGGAIGAATITDWGRLDISESNFMIFKGFFELTAPVGKSVTGILELSFLKAPSGGSSFEDVTVGLTPIIRLGVMV